MRKNKKNKMIKYLPVLIILLSITIMIGSTFAYFNDKTDKESLLTFDKVELSEETSVGLNGKILDCIPGSKIVDNAITFSKAVDSAPLYVRAKLSFSLPSEYRDDTKMQEILYTLRTSSDVNIYSEVQNGAVWSSKQGSYFYLLDKNDTTKLKTVDDFYTYTLSDAISLPRDLEQFEDKYQYMKTINFHIAFEAIQADNVSNVLKDTKLIFNDVFPSTEAIGATINVILKDFNLVDTLEILEYQEGDILFEPKIEVPVDENGNTLLSIEGWYEDENLQYRYKFGNKVYEDLTLYPKAIEIAKGLEFIPIYNSADKIVAYKVARGTCTETELLIPSWYNGKPVTTIAEDGFSGFVGLTSITLYDKITEIEANAFNGCTNLSAITIPENVIKIGEDAFFGCDNLATTSVTSLEDWLQIEFANGGANPINNSKNLYIENNVATFSLRSSSALLTHLEPPESISKINAYAFYNCQSLLSMTFKENITEIGEFAFYGCFNVTEVNIEGDVKIQDGAFSGCDKLEELPIPPKPSIGGYDNSGIINAIIPDGVKNILPGGFADCDNLSNVILPDSLESIGDNAFKNCINLTNLIIPSGVTNIGKDAFKGSGLKTITFKGTESIIIDPDAFDDTDIEDVIVDGDDGDDDDSSDGSVTRKSALEIWLSMKFANEYSNPVYYAKKLTLDGKVLTDLIVPSSVSEINAYAFINLETLVSTTIPSHLTKIGEKAFYGCINNKTVNNNSSLDIVAGATTHGFVAYYMVDNGLSYTAIYSGGKIVGYSVSQGLCNSSVLAIPATYNNYPVIEITANGFYENTILTEVILPDSITAIRDNAFISCSALKKINVPKKVENIGRYIFAYCSALEQVDFDAEKVSELSNSNYAMLYNSGSADNGLTLKVGANVTKVPAYIAENSNLNNLIFEEDCVCESIGAFAFDNTNLVSVILPDSVKMVESGIFGNITTLKTVTLSNSLTAISTDMFYGCSELTNIVIPDSVTLINDRAFYHCKSLESINLPQKITAIPYCAFTECEKLNNVVIPSKVTQIGNFAFGNCTALKNITLSDSVSQIGDYAFSYCVALENITLPDSVTQIGSYAFENCGITTITIPKNLTQLGVKAFLSCENVTTINFNATNLNTLSSTSQCFYWVGSDGDGVTVNIGANVKTISSYLFSTSSITYSPNIISILFEEGSQLETIGANAFASLIKISEITIPNTVTSIGDYAFSGCSGLKKVKLSENITSISDYLFNNCSSLSEIDIPSKVTSIGKYAFNNCSLNDITIGNNVTSIGEYAFNDCLSVTSIVIGESVTSIGVCAFYNCKNLSSIEFNAKKLPDLKSNNQIFNNMGNDTEGVSLTIGSNVEVIPAYLFYVTNNYNNLIFNSVTFAEGSKCKAINTNAFGGVEIMCDFIMPNTITSIGEYAFKYVKEVTFSTSLQSIGNYAFQSSDMTKIELYDGLKTIGIRAFYYCDLVTTLTIPDSVTSIGEYAFYYLEKLSTITIPENVVTLGSGAFESCTRVTTINYNAKYIENDNYITNIFYRTGSMYGVKLVIGENVENISDKLFQNVDITEIEFKGTKLTTIGAYAFEYCNMTSLSLPEGLTMLGNYAFSNCSKLETLSLPSTLTSVGDYAFQKTKITALTINSNITFGLNVFYNCSSLQSISILGGLSTIGQTIFKGCTALTTVNLGDSVKSIGQEAFSGCTNLANLTLSSNIETIDSQAFYDCSKLTKITLPTALKELGNSAFYNCTSLTEVVMGDNVETMGTSVFGSCSKLEKVNLSSKLTSIPNGTFSLCIALKSINIGSNITSIGSNAFNGCGLISITIPYGVTSIDNSAFSNCKSLTSFEFPSSVEKVGNSVLSSCTNLTSIKINSDIVNMSGDGFTTSANLFGGAGTNGTGITLTFGENVTKVSSSLCYNSSSSSNKAKITNIAFEGDKCTTIGGYAFYYCTYLTSVTIPSCVTEIGKCAFGYTSAVGSIYYNAEELTTFDTASFEGCGAESVSITIGNKVKRLPDLFRYMNDTITSITFEENSVCEVVGELAFYRRSSAITSLVLPDSITSIENSAFDTCNNLQSLTLSSNLESIGSSAFYNCTKLTEINLPDSLKTIENYAFYNCNSITSLTIPKNLTDIGIYVFDNAKLLTSITYKATRVEDITGEGILNNAGIDGEGINVTISSNVEVIPSNLFKATSTNEVVNIVDVNFESGSACVKIGAFAFYNSTTLTTINLPDTITEISDYAFYKCTKLELSTLPSGLITIGEYAFSEFSGLTISSLPSGVKNIGYRAFKSSSNITLSSLPSGLTIISSEAFYDCNKITISELPDGVTSIGYAAFSGCNNITLNSLPDSLVEIGESAFGACTKITLSSLPSGLTKLETRAFYGCYNITLTSIPDDVTSIGDYAFYNCQKLALTSLPSSLITIGSYSFYGCTGLTEFSVGTALESIGRSAFYSCNKISAVYYEGAQEEYDKIRIDQGNDPFTSHVVISWTQVSRVDATCTTEGLVVYTRGEGDAVETKEIVLPKLPHNIVNYACTECEYKVLTTLNLSPNGMNCFIESSDGTYYYSETKWSNQTYYASIKANFDCEIIITWSVWEYYETNNDKFYIKVNNVAISGVNGISNAKDGVNTISLKAGDVVSIQYVMDGTYDSNHGAKFSYTQSEIA